MPTITKNTTIRFQDDAGIRRRHMAFYTGPASYATGGDGFTPGDVNLGVIEMVQFELAINAGGTIYGLIHDGTNEKVIWYVLDTGSEVANGTDLSGFQCRFEAIGR